MKPKAKPAAAGEEETSTRWSSIYIAVMVWLAVMCALMLLFTYWTA